MLPDAQRDALQSVFADLGEVVVACSGGAASLLLAAAAHRFLAARARMIHVATDHAATLKLGAIAAKRRWDFTVVAEDEAKRGDARGGPGLCALIARMSDAPVCAGPAFAPGAETRAAQMRAYGVATPLFDLRVDEDGVRTLAPLFDRGDA